MDRFIIDAVAGLIVLGFLIGLKKGTDTREK